MNLLSGVLPILQTPFAEDESIDYPTLRATIDWAYQVGASGLGTGMVTEILKLTLDERRELTDWLGEINAGRGGLFVAVGAESSRQAVELAVHAQSAGCDAVMAAPPLSSRLSTDALLDYYHRLADAIDLPIIVQDASSYVGSSMPLQVYVQLLRNYGPEKIWFKPEASPVGPVISALRDASSGQARIFDGSGGILLVDCFRRGIVGTMPGLDLLDGIVALWKALEDQKEAVAYSVYYPICAIVTLQMQAGLDGFLAIEKHLLVQRGLWPSDRRRGPYAWSLDLETTAEVERLWRQLQLALSEVVGHS